MLPWRDDFERTHDDLRVSVTDRCDLRCLYCMPEEPEWFDRDDLLSYEELERVVRLFVRGGVRKVRLTGGEPLMRREIERFVERLAAIDGLDDLSLTTNGVRLAEMARPLRDAGLQRVNVSLDTLDRERFRAFARRDRLDRVLDGLAAARDAGLGPIKINAVLVNGKNDDEAEALAETARTEGWELRFIEVMPLENDGTWDASRVVSGESVRRRLDARWPLEAEPRDDPSVPARRWRYRDGRGRVGFVDSVHAPFCTDCSRLRLTCDGAFRNCLYDEVECDLRGPLRAGATDDALADKIRVHLAAKGRGGALDLLEGRRRGLTGRTMHQIGG